MGTYVADMDVVSETTRFATGRSEANGGAGDSSVLTAFGVFQGQRAARPAPVGRAHPRGPHRRHRRRRQGRTASSPATCSRTAPSVVVTDVNDAGAWRALKARTRRSRSCRDAATPGDARTSTSTPPAPSAAPSTTRPSRRCGPRVVCGGANNQLVDRGPGRHRRPAPERGITYAPDFLVNAGGVIQVSDELHGFDFERAKKGAAAIFDHTLEVLETADARGITPAAAADHIAEERMAARQAAGIWLPAR